MIRAIAAALLLLGAAVWGQEYGLTERQRIAVGSENRKVVFFLPKGLKKNDTLPLLVAIPDYRGAAYHEVGQWQQQAFEHRFAIVSVDVTTSGNDGWSPRDQVPMVRDMEAVEEAMKAAIKWVESQGAHIDRSATVITGHSGGTYLTLWMGLRRPDLFLGVAGRSCVFHKETVEFGKLDTKPDLGQRIFIYRGEIDNPRAIDQTEAAIKAIREAGFKRAEYKVVPKMVHESKPEVFLEWYYKLLKETAKGRAGARKVAAELEKVKEAIEKKRAGAYGKLQKLADRERKAGFAAGAIALLQQVSEEAQKAFKHAEDLEANHDFATAIKALKEIEKTYAGLEIAKKARAFAATIRKSDGFLAAEMLEKAKELKAKGRDVQAAELLEKITKKYPETSAGEEASRLLHG
jgi:predicted esterase